MYVPRLAILSCFVAFALASAGSASASVVLTFGVSNVQRNDCSGALQPTCTASSAASFTQRIRFDGPFLQGSDGSFGNFQQTSAAYGLPTWLDATPYSAILSSRLTGPVTDDYSSVQLDNFYDSDAAVGGASALIQSDQVSDMIDGSGVRNQQEYKLAYNLLSATFFSPNWYTDLVNDTADNFFQRYHSLFSGSYDELGTFSALNPTTLNFDAYAFTEYTGDISLLDVANVPEPGSLALSLITLAGLARVNRRRVERASSLA